MVTNVNWTFMVIILQYIQILNHYATPKKSVCQLYLNLKKILFKLL